jgi:hypothetical protein
VEQYKGIFLFRGNELCSLIEKTLGCKIIEVKRRRKNNHFYICSKKLLQEIREHYRFEASWNPFQKEEINKLKEWWNRYEY